MVANSESDAARVVPDEVLGAQHALQPTEEQCPATDSYYDQSNESR